MDPDACWSDIRQSVHDLDHAFDGGDDDPDTDGMREDIANRVRDLCEWLDNGGFPPVAFEPNLSRAHITSRDATYVLHVLEDSTIGYPPGDFFSELISTCCRADQENLRHIARGFPGIAAAVKTYKNDMDGVAWLKNRAVQ